ncbi:MAG: trehalose operon repressor [Hespellia sp.]|nr:trehalose operon repressor [Hespellia sp.]
MPGAKYNIIYDNLRGKIEEEEYEFQSMLPSEHQLVEEYECSRNTVRRAIKQLADKGYVQSIHGKGVQIIYQPMEQAEFLLSGIESLKEAVARNNQKYVTKVICFTELTVDKKISRRTSFPEGAKIYYIQRVRYIDGEALIIDHNYFLKSVVRDLTREIAEKSVYEYMEGPLGESIVTTKRKLTVEMITELDAKCVDMKGYNCMAVVSSHTFNAEGVMFEYTQSRHRPDKFVFYDQAQRVK